MQTKPQLQSPSKDWLGLALILLSSLLLGIWTVKGTIALRNILLSIETILAIIYCYQLYKTNPKIPLKNWVPLILLGLMFLWVIFHYFFLSRFPEQQFHELTSTWLRSGLATIVGVGTGLALLRRPNAINFLWLGILGSFAYLFYQYIPKAIALNSLFAPDYVNHIFYGKISGVLAGTILMIGLLGTLLDTSRRGHLAATVGVFIFTLLGLTANLYVQVFILDARNGVGLAVILLTIFCIIFIGNLLISIFNNINARGLNAAGGILALILFIALVLVTGWAVKKHVQHNSGWSSMWADAKTSIQIDQYPNWQDPRRLGYPQNSEGQVVKGNTYERLAWATAGATVFMPENPYGVGVLKGPFTVLMKQSYPNSITYLPSTHSAWVELGLAFGYPGLFLLLAALFSLGYLALSAKSSFRSTALLFSLGLLALYTVGELSSQHSVEILFFLIALATALFTPKQPPKLLT